MTGSLGWWERTSIGLAFAYGSAKSVRHAIDTLRESGDPRAAALLAHGLVVAGPRFSHRDLARYSDQNEILYGPFVAAFFNVDTKSVAARGAVTFLLDALKDERVCGEALWALGEFLDNSLTTPLITALKRYRDRDRKHLVDRIAWLLARIGDAEAISPLIEIAGREETAIDPRPLEQLMEKNAPDLPNEILKRAAALKTFVYKADPQCQGDWDRTIDPSAVVQLARQELIRRGMKA